MIFKESKIYKTLIHKKYDFTLIEFDSIKLIDNIPNNIPNNITNDIK